MSAPPADESPVRISRGRIDKHEAILRAAFEVFSRKGYAQASIDVIAAEAGVAKPTVYNHFGDKEQLFREAIMADAESVTAKNLAAVDRLVDTGDDVRAGLEDAGYQLLRCHCDDQSWALRRLLYAEIVRFPDLLDVVRGRTASHVEQALADRLARLSVTGHLHITDPVVAAEQFIALLTGPVDTHSRLGTRRLSENELRSIVDAAVSTFLQAYGAPSAAEKSPPSTA